MHDEGTGTLPILLVPARKPRAVQVRRAHKAREGTHNWLVHERVSPWSHRTFVYDDFTTALTNADLLARTGKVGADGLLSAHGTSERRKTARFIF